MFSSYVAARTDPGNVGLGLSPSQRCSHEPRGLLRIVPSENPQARLCSDRGFERNGDVTTGMRRWRSALRLLNSAIGGSKLSLSLGVRDGTGFLPFPLSWVRPKANGWQAGPRFSPRDPMSSHNARNPLRKQNKPMTQHDNTVKIRELVDRQVQAWEKHDFGIAAPDWLASGELISPGGACAR